MTDYDPTQVGSKPSPDEACPIPDAWLDSVDLPPLSDLAFLDAPETDLQRAVDRAGADLEREPNLSTTFRHSGWRRERRLVAASLVRTNQPTCRREAFRWCGSDAYVLQSLTDPGVYRIAGSSCHDRFCLPCARERSNAIALNVLERVKGKSLRFLTLTVKSTDETLKDRLDHLYSSFQTLRRRAFWTSRVTGGVAFLELKWNSESCSWHPHFHIVIEGRYMAQQKLKSIWWAITGDSHIVDIRLVRDVETAARYVTKYASKPFNNSFVNRPIRLDEAVLALKGRKLLTTFGDWRGITLQRPPDPTAWVNIGPLEDFLKFRAPDVGRAGQTADSLANCVRRALEARASPVDMTPLPPAQDLGKTRLFPDDNIPTSRRRPQQPT